MAEEPWNKVNIPFPSAVCFARLPMDGETGSIVKHVLGDINKILILLESKILQTEIRLLYELMYVLNNNLSRNKTMRVLKQVEQCTNRLKTMRLDVALRDLKDLCPRTSDLNKRLTAMESVECDVPSQPMLEWICLKVLGAARLMSCALRHCTRAFILSKQHLRASDFIVVNVVVHTMLSRLWVFFRGLLAHLAPLYQHALMLLRAVAQVRPMPFLRDFSLPADMAQFLGPSDASLLAMKFPSVKAAPWHAPSNDRQERAGKKKAVTKKAAKKTALKKTAVTTERRQWREELGLPVERVNIATSVDMKSLLKIFSDFTEGSSEERSSSEDPAKIHQKTMFKNRVKAATTFADMAAHLEEMIPWCKSHNLQQEKRCLAFLHLKCQKMKYLELAGYNVQRKLRSFKREACWASSPRGSVPRTCLSVAALWRSAHRRPRIQTLRARCRPTAARAARVRVKRKLSQIRKRRTELSALEEEQGSDVAGTGTSRTSPKFTPHTSACVSEDEIDGIFSSFGF